MLYVHGSESLEIILDYFWERVIHSLSYTRLFKGWMFFLFFAIETVGQRIGFRVETLRWKYGLHLLQGNSSKRLFY